MLRGLTITTLGELAFQHNGEFVTDFSSRKTEALLVYLAVERGYPHRRESLFTLLWPGMPEKSARHNLRQHLYALRQLFPNVTAHEAGEGVPLLLVDRQTVEIDPQAIVDVDVHRLDRILEGTRGHNHLSLAGCEACLQALKEAVDVYTGEFLSGFYLEDSNAFEDWATANRTAYRHKVLEALETLTGIYIQRGEYRQARTHAERQLTIDPLREGAYRQLMEVLSRSGQRAEALRVYQHCARVLESELGAQPSQQTKALFEIISGEDLRQPASPRQEGSFRGYEIREHLGSGHTGMVYRAFQPVIGRDVAIKVILPQFANHPDFIRRFEVEAQLVARLEHPHIVPLYDYWRDPSGAYLVMRWLKGGSLQAHLARGAWKPLPAVQLVEQIAAALALAHRQGVVHCDIKPANILLDEEGNAYLTDFGIAILTGPLAQLSHYTRPDAGDSSPGSLGYSSPETARGLETTPLADIYSLGVVLYELLCGRHPFPGLQGEALVQKHLTEPLPSVLALRPELPEAVDRVIQRATQKDPAQRYQDVEALAREFRTALTPEGAIPLEAPTVKLELRNPYKGLRPFAEADALDFFGRDDLVNRLLARLSPREDRRDQAPFLAVVGPSGSGKSSVVKAGLIPAIRKGAVPGSERWFVVEMTPGAHPLEELETALLRIAMETPTDLLEQLSADRRGFVRLLRRALPDPESQVLLVIDQFEELFTLVADEAERNHFLDVLASAARQPHSPLRLVITLRADFYDRPLQHIEFGELVREATEVVLPLSPEELERAICGPAEQVGMLLEPALVARLIQEIGDQPGSLPLLQYALTECFERREGSQLTLAAYEASGGVLGALGRRAEEIYTHLNEDEQEMTRQLFLRLVTLGEGTEDTRRRVLRVEVEAVTNLAGDGGQETGEGLRSALIAPVIDRYGRYRLLTFDHDPATRAPTLEVAHEALLREWKRLRNWLDDSREDVLMQRRLGAATIEWQAADRAPGFLMRGARLDQFALWMEGSNVALTEAEGAYLEASLEARRERRAAEAARQAHEAALERRARRVLQGLVAVFFVAAILSGILALVAFQQRQTAQTQAGILLASQAEAELEAGYTDRAVLLALEALENYPYTSQAEHALGQAVSYNRALQQYTAHQSAVTSVAWSPDGTRVASSSTDNSVHVWDASTGETLLVIDLPQGITGNHFDWALSVKWSPDGEHLLTVSGDRWKLGSQDYDLILWDARSGEQLTAVDIPNQAEPEEGDATTGYTNYATAAAAEYAPRSGRLATLGGDNSALVWDASLQAQELTLSGHENDVNAVAWSPDETYLATASEDGTARLWDARSGEELQVLRGHEGGVNVVLWSPDGTQLATAGDDGVVRLWDAVTGEMLDSLEPQAGIVWSLAWSPDGEYLVTGTDDATIRIWEIDSREVIDELKGHADFIAHLAWSPVDDRLASSDAKNTARIWNAAPSTAAQTLPYRTVSDFAWSSDGRYLALPAGDPGWLTTREPGALAIWDVAAGGPVTHKLDTDFAYSMMEADYSPDNRLLLVRGISSWPDGLSDLETMHVLDASTGKLVKSFTVTDGSWIRSSSWSTDGTQVAGGTTNDVLYLWDFQTGELLDTLVGHQQGELMIDQVVWSPDGAQIATASDDGTARVWDVATGETLLVLAHEQPTVVWSVAWSPDGARLLTTSGYDDIGAEDTTIRVWDAKTGEELLVIRGHTGQVTLGDWSPDGSRIVSASSDGTTRIWDAATRDELLRLSTPAFYFIVSRWSPDGRYVAVGMEETPMEVWRVWQSAEELIDYARDCCVFRDLTAAERTLYSLPER